MFGYLSPRGAVDAFRDDYPTANRWCSWSIGAYALCFRLVPLAAVGLAGVALSGSQVGLALGFPSFVLVLLGTVLAIVGGAVGHAPDFWPQVVLPLGFRYAIKPQPNRLTREG